ncbi:OsmC family protein [Streptomyces sp. TRM66268-LWL]|uniref:OsmC family protein n=1 Tax=Streptomyces polyasparticus TaxID=2767826 RepID=A0ABR7S9F4_9ACTN|nr:OsmC family protein [Streptomyces polyasparticus]MBC9711161.1 OsmC family protein [Streptomyces polyasparticus]
MADYRIETTRNGYRDWTARNERGAEVRMAAADDDSAQPSFTPVELLLAAMGGCSGMVLDRTARAVEHDDLAITIESVSTPEDDGRIGKIRVTYELDIPADANNGKAAEVFARGVRLTHEQFCTVSRTVEHGARVEAILPDGSVGFEG